MPVSRTLMIVIGLLALIAAIVIVRLNGGGRELGERVETIAGDVGSPRPIAGGNFEASGLAYIPGTNRLLFVDDDKERELYVLELDSTGTQRGGAAELLLGGADVTDMEGATSDGEYFYVVGSQSKTTGFEGDGLVRFRLDSSGRRITTVEPIPGLKAWLAANVPELHGTANRIGDDVLNIEALAWDPEHRRLLLGLRAPVVHDSALVIPIVLRDSTRTFSAANLRLDSATIRLDLGGAGLRAMEFDPETRTYLLVTGASLDAESRDFRVLEWDGRRGGTLRQVASFPRQLKPEGIARATIHGRSMRVVVFDAGSYAVLP